MAFLGNTFTGPFPFHWLSKVFDSFYLHGKQLEYRLSKGQQENCTKVCTEINLHKEDADNPNGCVYRTLLICLANYVYTLEMQMSKNML